MTRLYTVSIEVHELFRQHSNNLDESQNIVEDGLVTFPVADDTAERLEAHRKPLETNDQLFSRILGRRPN